MNLTETLKASLRIVATLITNVLRKLLLRHHIVCLLVGTSSFAILIFQYQLLCSALV